MLVEFNERYPDYKLGFLQTNPKTETEKLVGYRMHITWTHNKVYQTFSIPNSYYAQLLERVKNCKPGNLVEMTLNDATLHLVKRDESIVGYCLQTKERVMIDEPLNVVLTPE